MRAVREMLSTPDTPVLPMGDWRARVLVGWLGLLGYVGGVVYVLGGLGTTALICLIGLSGLLLLHPSRLRGGPVVKAGVFMGLLLLWAGISLLWSPVVSPERFGACVGVIVLGAMAIGVAGEIGRPAQRGGILAIFFTVATLPLLAELTTGGVLTAAGLPPDAPQYLVWRNVGHGISGLLILAPVALAYVWGKGRWGLVAAVVLIATLALGGTVTGMSANALGLLVMLAAMVAAWHAPRLSFRVAHYGLVTSIALAPFLGFIAARLTATLDQSLPLSWAQRLHGWAEVASRIPERPFTGQGFDASRVLDVERLVGGQLLDVVPLHPHNGGLQIWYELGAIGALLASVLILRIGDLFMDRVAVERRSYAAATGIVAAFACMNMMTYGIWQEWWLANLFLAALAWRLAFGRAP